MKCIKKELSSAVVYDIYALDAMNVNIKVLFGCEDSVVW
jgi:hypothetical protein